MAPIAVDSHVPLVASKLTAGLAAAVNGSSARTPLRVSGALDRFVSEDVTPIIGREFSGVNIVDDLLNGSDADVLLRDLAITISERGVVFFRQQDNLTLELQKQLVQRLGELTGKPKTSTLHIHPAYNNTDEFGVPDAEISTISSQARKKYSAKNSRKVKYDAAVWHSDIQFEPVPADYTSLRLIELPETGGDTLWASGYEIYDRFSKPYQQFLEGLEAYFAGEEFKSGAEAGFYELYDKPRGSPENLGTDLAAVHPVVRTNPVTGWRSVFALGPFPRYIQGLHPEESDELLAKIRNVLLQNHDLQVRFKWRNKNDIAIWDNRSTFHAATFDYDKLGERVGVRSVGIGERPYFDPSSKSRTEDLVKRGVGSYCSKNQND